VERRTDKNKDKDTHDRGEHRMEFQKVLEDVEIQVALREHRWKKDIPE
jgi:hypothetical protein